MGGAHLLVMTTGLKQLIACLVVCGYSNRYTRLVDTDYSIKATDPAIKKGEGTLAHGRMESGETDAS